MKCNVCCTCEAAAAAAAPQRPLSRDRFGSSYKWNTILDNRCKGDERAPPSKNIPKNQLTYITASIDDPEARHAVNVHPSIAKRLKQHQIVGLTDLFERWHRGCVLGYEMGLGKTIMIMTLLHTLMAHERLTRVKRAMIVVPFNVTTNWINEIGKWLDGLPVYGQRYLPIFVLSKYKSMSDRILALRLYQARGGTLIISYKSLIKLVEHAKRMTTPVALKNTIARTFRLQEPDILILDEGHVLCSHTTILYKIIREIPTSAITIMTGTPIQHSLVDLYTIVDFVRPGYLGTRGEFKKIYESAINEGYAKEADENERQLMHSSVEKLRKLCRNVIIRLTHVPSSSIDFENSNVSRSKAQQEGKKEFILCMKPTELQYELRNVYLEYCQAVMAKSNKGFGQVIRNELEKIYPHRGGGGGSDSRSNGNSNETTSSGGGGGGTTTCRPILKGSSIMVTMWELQLIATHPMVLPIAESRRKKGSRRHARATPSARTNADKRIDGCEDNDLIALSPTQMTANTQPTPPWKTPPVESFAISNKKCSTDLELDEQRTIERNRNKGERKKERRGDRPWWWGVLNNRGLEPCKQNQSRKILVLLSILREAKAIGDKVLIFSRYLSVLDYIEETLGGRVLVDQNTKSDQKPHAEYSQTWQLNVDMVRIDGNMSSDKRDSMVRRFENMDSEKLGVCLVSLKAACCGINLQAANRVVLMEPSWSHADVLQAMGRAHRIGQTKRCYIYHFVCDEFAEMRMMTRQIIKRNIFKYVLNGDYTPCSITDTSANIYFATTIPTNSDTDRRSDFGDLLLTRALKSDSQNGIVVLDMSKFTGDDDNPSKKK